MIQASSYYFSVYFWAGLVNAYIALWLRWKGLTYFEVSSVMASAALIKVVVDPLIATLSDRTGARKRILAILIACMGFSFVMLGLVESKLLIVSFYVLSFAFWATVLPLGDSLAAQQVSSRGISFPIVRVWGSVSVLIAVFIGSAMTNRVGMYTLMPLLVASLLCCFVSVMSLPEVETPRATRIPLSQLAKDRAFVLVGLSASLILGGHHVFYTIGPIYLTEAGFLSGQITTVWAVALGAEIVVFLIARRRFDAIRPVQLLAWCSVAGIVRWIGFSLGPTPLQAAGLQLLQGLTLAAVTLALMRFIADHVDSSSRTSAFAAVALFSHAILPAAASFAAGPIYVQLKSLVFLIPATMSACSLAILLLSQPLLKDRAMLKPS